MEAEGLETGRTCEVWKPGLKDLRKPGFIEDRSFLGRNQGRWLAQQWQEWREKKKEKQPLTGWAHVLSVHLSCSSLHPSGTRSSVGLCELGVGSLPQCIQGNGPHGYRAHLTSICSISGLGFSNLPVPSASQLMHPTYLGFR